MPAVSARLSCSYFTTILLWSTSGMLASSNIDLRDHIRNIPDFPKAGIQFKDITPLIAHAEAFRATIDRLAGLVRDLGVDVVASAEARGFIFGAPLAIALDRGFVPIRKPGKLPFEKIALEYQLEYGSDRLEVHADAFVAGRRVLLLDDVLATGGTMRACCDLAVQTGAEVVACAFVVELGFLKGRLRLDPFPVRSLISYE
jgi:adenine phosphoribosyltransferase